MIADPWLLYGLTTLVGLAVGSFLNVVVHRLPARLEYGWRGECRELLGLEAEQDPPPPGLWRPGSRCPHCGHGIRAWENIPILSWLLLRGRCAACGRPIGWHYPLVEALTALLSLLVIWRLGPTWAGAAGLGFTWALIALALIDLDTQLLPDVITLPLVWAGLLLSLKGVFTDPASAITGAAAGYLALWTVYHGFRLATGKRGMGHGDFKLLAAVGAWLGWQYLPQVILLSAFVGALVGLALILFRGHRREIPIPFGPYLAAAAWIGLLWGPEINRIYLLWAHM